MFHMNLVYSVKHQFGAANGLKCRSRFDQLSPRPLAFSFKPCPSTNFFDKSPPRGQKFGENFVRKISDNFTVFGIVLYNFHTFYYGSKSPCVTFVQCIRGKSSVHWKDIISATGDVISAFEVFQNNTDIPAMH